MRVAQTPSRLTGQSDCLILVLNSPIRKLRRSFTRQVRDAVLLGRLTRRAVTVVAGWLSKLLLNLLLNQMSSPPSTSGDGTHRPPARNLRHFHLCLQGTSIVKSEDRYRRRSCALCPRVRSQWTGMAQQATKPELHNDATLWVPNPH